MGEQERQQRYGRRDDEQLASAARAVSGPDLEYSTANAASDAEQARQYMEEADAGATTPSKEMTGIPTLGRITEVASFGLFQTEEDQDEDEDVPSMAAGAKGFGFSPDQLL